MRQDYGIREKATGEIVKTFDDPFEARAELDNMPEADKHEVVERSIENIYELFPDNKVYITGVKEIWKEYK